MFIISVKDITNLIKKIIVFFLIISIFSLILKQDIINKDAIDKTFLLSYYIKKSDKRFAKNGSKKILSNEFVLFSIDKKVEKANENIENDKEEIKYEKEIEEKKEVVIEKQETRVISQNNISEKYTDVIKDVKIRNESSYNLSGEQIDFNFELSNTNNIVIYHTHTCESYTPSEQNNYEQTSNFRTTDLNYTVAKVGDELENNLIKLGFNVLHDKTYHDYPAYNGSYNRGYSTISRILTTNNSDFIIDLHRDALGNMSTYAPTIQIGDETVAQVMFVIGTDGGDLEHPEWRKNLANAIKIQEKANELYPGFFKPIIVRNSRYNQHVSNGACIIEVGATGNTLEECTGSMKYLANIIYETFK